MINSENRGNFIRVNFSFYMKILLMVHGTMEHFGISFIVAFNYLEKILINLFSTNFTFIKTIFPKFLLSIFPIINK